VKISDIRTLDEWDNRSVRRPRDGTSIWTCDFRNDYNVEKFKSFDIQQVYHGANPLTYCDLQVRHSGLSCEFADFCTHMEQARESC